MPSRLTRKMPLKARAGWEDPLSIPFPEDEVPALAGRKSIVTHRVSDECWRYHEGDLLLSPWGTLYRCVRRVELSDIRESPFLGELSSRQVEECSRFGRVSVLWLESSQVPSQMKKISNF